MKTRIRWKLLWAVAAVAALTPAVFGYGEPRPGRRGALLERAIERLDLTSEQRQQIDTILDARRAEIRGQLEALRTTRQTQLEPLRGQAFDEQKIRAAAAALGQARADLMVTRARLASEVRAVLTAEQRAELDRMRDDCGALRGRLAGRRSR